MGETGWNATLFV